MPPTPCGGPSNTDWSPFRSRVDFEVADFLYRRDQMSQGHVSELMDLWAASLVPYGARPPFANCDEMLATIDTISHGDAPWFCFEVSYEGPLPEENIPSWMTEKYLVWTRNIRMILHIMIKNGDYNGEFDYAPYVELGVKGERILTNLMSGNWAWRQAVSGRCFNLNLVKNLPTTNLPITGRNRRGSHDPWGDVCSLHSGERQDHCLRGHWTK